MSNVKIDIVSQFKGKKEFDKAGKAVSGLEGAVNKLGKQFAALYSVSKIAAFGKASVKAFMADEKSAALLANTLKNLGIAFADTDVEAFISKLSKASGVADDELRPAMQKLLQTTGSISKSQEILSSAIDVSRGSSVDLGTVVSDLSAAYVGNVKGLKKYAIGLTQAELKAATFADIQKKLNSQFGGASQAYLSTYTGKMEVLTTAAGEAKESIGKGLVDAFTTLGSSGSNDIQDAADSMQNLADNTANAIRGVAVLLSKLSNLGSDNSIGNALHVMVSEIWSAVLTPYRDLANLGAKSYNSKLPNPSSSMHIKDLENLQHKKALTKAEIDAAKRAKELARLQALQTKALKDQALLKKQGALFDIQQANLIAALKGQLSEDERNRVLLQLALLQGNEEEAKRLSATIADSIDKTGKLKDYITSISDTNPFKSWQDYLDGVLATVKLINATATGAATVVPVNPTTGTLDYGGHVLGSEVPNFTPSTNYGLGGSRTDSAASVIKVEVNMDGKTVAEGMQNQSMNGNNTTIYRGGGGGFQFL